MEKTKNRQTERSGKFTDRLPYNKAINHQRELVFQLGCVQFNVRGPAISTKKSVVQ